MNGSVIRLHVKPLDECGYVATSFNVPGLVTEGRTIAETAKISQGLARKIADFCLEHGDPLPPVLQDSANARAVDIVVPVGIR